MKAAPSVLVIGSSNTDLTVRMDRLPKPGETVLGGHFSTAAGGKGANQAVAAARAGATVTFIARIGRDPFGDQALVDLAADGIHLEFVIRDKSTPSGVALIFVAASGENSIAVASGSNGQLTPADLKKARQAFVKADALVLQLESPLRSVQAAAGMAAATGVPVILNPAPAQMLPKSLWRRISLLTPNEHEAELLTGITVKDRSSAASAAAAIHAKGVPNVVITMGSRGAFVSAQGSGKMVPGYKIKPLDSTAAGDVFTGSLAVALAEGRPLFEAARFANAAAALSVTRLGAQPSAPRRQEIERWLAHG